MKMRFEIAQYRIAKGDESAFRELFESFFPGLFSYCTSLLKDRLLAEEVVEDVFVKLWENRTKIVFIDNISHYLYKAVKYASINAMEKQNRTKSISLEDIGDALTYSFSQSESTLISKENCQKISEAVNELPPKCRLIFRLIKEEGMKYKEVAQLLGLSEKTVENQMNIAIRKLIESLKISIPEFNFFFISNKN